MKNTKQAEALGAAAFISGKPRIPGQDTSALLALKTGPAFSAESTRLFAAWLRGWDRENLRAEG